MHALAAMRELDVWYAQTRIDDALQASVRPKVAAKIAVPQIVPQIRPDHEIACMRCRS